MEQEPDNAEKTDASGYVLDDQVGFILRQVTQRHLILFSQHVPEVTTTQFAVMARLCEMGALSQNLLGRAAAMDAATVKGVVDRLAKQGLVSTKPDKVDRRRLLVDLTPAGLTLIKARLRDGLAVSGATLAPLSPAERKLFVALLARLV